ncbi:hypothetical protein [Dysgonomonas sp. UBA7698]|uniref:hypothetical protein n=1 Tax=Dysgonomonas sp. UBA7698 TaxID=1946427 RepID=UPI0025BEE312|nr:hypothetical protein [Dysgonomonas sp. UBA7698]
MEKEYYRLKLKREIIKKNMKALIIRAIQENGGKISLQQEEEDENTYPSGITFYGKRDIYFISITDVYMDEEGKICMDGIDENTVEDFTGIYIEDQHLDDVLYFIGFVLDWFDNQNGQQVIDNTNSSIMQLACELAEKELVDKYSILPEAMMDESGENYTDKYQDGFNLFYDKYYNQIAGLADFEY